MSKNKERNSVDKTVGTFLQVDTFTMFENKTVELKAIHTSHIISMQMNKNLNFTALMMIKTTMA